MLPITSAMHATCNCGTQHVTNSLLPSTHKPTAGTTTIHIIIPISKLVSCCLHGMEDDIMYVCICLIQKLPNLKSL